MSIIESLDEARKAAQLDIAEILTANDSDFSSRLTDVLKQSPKEITFFNDIPFRNKTVAELASNIETPEGIDAIETLLRERDTLTIPVRSVVLRTPNSHTDNIYIIGATDRGEGEMNGSIWIRDQAQFVLAANDIYASNPEKYRGHKWKSGEVLTSLLSIMSTPAQLERFDEIIKHAGDEIYIKDPSHWPHIFLNIKNLDGNKVEGWGHKQDAWQMLVWATFDGLEKGTIAMEDLSPSHRQFLSKVVPFLEAVDFTNRENCGSWEEIEAVRSSTLAWEVSILEKIGEYTSKPGFEFLSEGFVGRSDSDSFSTHVDQMVTKGLRKLDSMIPFESPTYDPTDPRYREADAALIYLLELNIPEKIARMNYPIEDRNAAARNLEFKILQQVMSLQNQQSRGIRRYKNDSYQGEGFYSYRVQTFLSHMYAGAGASSDFSRVGHFVGRNEVVGKGKEEAAWSHFNPQLSIWAGKRYLETGDVQYKQLQHDFFLNSLAMITGKDEFSILHGRSEMLIQSMPRFRYPECYITVALKDGTKAILPGPYTPLNWGVAKLEQAIIQQRTTLLQ